MTTPHTRSPDPGRDAHHVPLSTADKLAQDAADAKRVRALANHPDVVALRTEKVRTQVDAALWVGILLGLAFTMVNVQQFAAAGADTWSLPWIAAWLLDPMVSITLIAVLRAEQITARYQVHTGIWAHRTKWFTFAATYLMNTWAAWHTLDPAGIVLHSVPPILVFCAAETAPWLRDRLTEAVNRAGRHAATDATEADRPTTVSCDESVNTTRPATPGVHEPGRTPVPDPGAEPVHGSSTEPVRDSGESSGAPSIPVRAQGRSDRAGSARSGGRKLLGAYLAEARAAHTPDVVITPAWVRSVTDCGRGTSKKVADTLHDELDATPEPHADAVTASTGAASTTANEYLREAAA